MAGFVILRHDDPRGLHFDFMLEMGGVLKTWSVPQLPAQGKEITCRALPDHRTAYLEYEGPLAGSRGSVTRCDRGTYSIEHQSDSELVVILSGEKLTGRVTLRRVPGEPNLWSFCNISAV